MKQTDFLADLQSKILINHGVHPLWSFSLKGFFLHHTFGGLWFQVVIRSGEVDMWNAGGPHKCLLSLQLCGFQDLCKRRIFLNMQVLIWYKAAGAAFHILCSSLNGMSCSNVFQVHQKQKRPQIYLYQIHDMWHGVQQSQANYTHTYVFLLFKGKKPTLGFVVAIFTKKKHGKKITARLKTSQKEAPLLPSKVSQRFKPSIVGRAPPFHGGSFSWWNLTPNIWGWKTFFGTWSTSPKKRLISWINVRSLKTMETFVIPVGYHTEISHRYEMKQTDQVFRWRRNNGINKYTLSDLPPVASTWSTVAAKCPRWWSAVST